MLLIVIGEQIHNHRFLFEVWLLVDQTHIGSFSMQVLRLYLLGPANLRLLLICLDLKHFTLRQSTEL